MGIQDFIEFLLRVGIKAPIYPHTFPAKVKPQGVIVEVGQGFNGRGEVSDITLTITVRSDHPAEAENLGQTINTILTDLTGEMVANRQVILVKSQQVLPNYLGKDEDDLHYYMNNFKVLLG